MPWSEVEVEGKLLEMTFAFNSVWVLWIKFTLSGLHPRTENAITS